MPDFTIRPVNPETDYDDIANLINIGFLEARTADDLREADAKRVEEDFLSRFVACIGETVIGYGYARLDHTELSPRYTVIIIIYPDYRTKGYGAKLYEHVAGIAKTAGATQILSACLDDNPAALKFAEDRGFVQLNHSFGSILDLENFDESRFIHIVDNLEKEGINITSLEAEGNSESVMYEAFKLFYETMKDETADAVSNTEPDFEKWKKDLIEPDKFHADGLLLAKHGDNYIGLAIVALRSDGMAENYITGVSAAYRGRKIAQALKVIGARYAKQKGMSAAITYNDDKNVGMLAINEKLGYVRQTGFYRLLKDNI